jgi:hypothetical protein
LVAGSIPAEGTRTAQVMPIAQVSWARSAMRFSGSIPAEGAARLLVITDPYE